MKQSYRPAHRCVLCALLGPLADCNANAAHRLIGTAPATSTVIRRPVNADLPPAYAASYQYRSR